MFRYPINDLTLMVTGLLTASTLLKFAKDLSAPIPDPDWLTRVSVALDGLHNLGTSIELDSSLLQHMSELKDELTPDCQLPAMVIKTKLDMVIDGVQENLNKLTFMYVPLAQAPYWENDEFFGDDFIISFPKEAIIEGIAAGNCYAAGFGTSCVFHCMRVSEYALRVLARRLRVTITDRNKACPIEFGDWDKVITAIKAKIVQVRQKPKGVKRERELETYSSVADHCEYMKDIWRNQVAHTRRRYSNAEALGVLNRVRDFVQLIAKPEADKRIRRRLLASKRASLLGGKQLNSLAALMRLLPDKK